MEVINHTPLVMAVFHVDDGRVGFLIFFYCSLFDANFVRKNKTLCESNDLAEFAFYLSVFFFSLPVLKPSNIFFKSWMNLKYVTNILNQNLMEKYGRKSFLDCFYLLQKGKISQELPLHLSVPFVDEHRLTWNIICLCWFHTELSS